MVKCEAGAPLRLDPTCVTREELHLWRHGVTRLMSVAMAAGHIDALTAKLKPVSKEPNTAGYLQLGVAPYAGALGPTWCDRPLPLPRWSCRVSCAAFCGRVCAGKRRFLVLDGQPGQYRGPL